MQSAAAIGVYGINVDVVKVFMHNQQFAALITDLLQNVLDTGIASPLLLLLLTAIPKHDRPTNVAKKYIPSSVNSVWYRLLMQIFVMRLD